jgi:hypothetical protein
MTSEWMPTDTSTHQDHVIAHVIGATVLGYFILDETLHLLLDMGFIWSIYVDGEMGLLSQGLLIGGLDLDEQSRQQLLTDADLLQKQGRGAEGLTRIMPAAADYLIKEVNFFMNGDWRRLLLTGEEASLVVATSLTTAEIHVYEL